MKQTPSFTGDQLARSLEALGIRFLMEKKIQDDILYLSPEILITELAKSNEARLRLSLIPVFLSHPEFAFEAINVSEKLEGTSSLTLKCYYSAAVFLAQKHQSQLKRLLDIKLTLPDLFSKSLGVTISKNPEDNLKSLADYHQKLSHTHTNWFGTYEHAIQIWLKGLELQKS